MAQQQVELLKVDGEHSSRVVIPFHLLLGRRGEVLANAFLLQAGQVSGHNRQSVRWQWRIRLWRMKVRNSSRRAELEVTPVRSHRCNHAPQIILRWPAESRPVGRGFLTDCPYLRRFRSEISLISNPRGERVASPSARSMDRT